jgi:hypothetical protein
MSVTKVKPAIQKFIRVPVDQTLRDEIDNVMLQNPFFNELDAIRFLLGKQIVQEQDTRRKAAGVRLVNLQNSMPELALSIKEKNNLRNFDK